MAIRKGTYVKLCYNGKEVNISFQKGGKKKRKIPLKWAILGVFSAPSSLASILRLVAQAKCYRGWGGPGSPGSKAQLCSRLAESLTLLVWPPPQA